MEKDSLFSEPLQSVAGFTFDSKVVEVFPDMIQRSVPGYATIIAMTGTLAERYAQPDSHCYDLGCSLGASTLAMAERIDAADCRLVAVDNAPAMIARCEEIVRHRPPRVPVELRCEDIRDTALGDASMVVMNFTLQFLPPAARDALLLRIYQALRPGGVLLLSEKIAFADLHHNALMVELHHHFKRANGYSALEVSQKRAALENVLIPETLHQHHQRLAAAGFERVDPWFQCFNFASLLAVK